MAYATPDDLLIRYDQRRVADLVSDTGTRSPDPVTSPVVASILEDASGMVEAACRVAGRYTIPQLTALQGHTKFLLTRIVCDIAYGLLVARRGYSVTDQNTMAPQYKFALDLLEQLKKGERIFDYPGMDTHSGSGGGSSGGSGSGGSQPHHDGNIPSHTAAQAGYKVIGMKTYTKGVLDGTDLVGRSRRLWGQRNMT